MLSFEQRLSLTELGFSDSCIDNNIKRFFLVFKYNSLDWLFESEHNDYEVQEELIEAVGIVRFPGLPKETESYLVSFGILSISQLQEAIREGVLDNRKLIRDDCLEMLNRIGVHLNADN